MRYLKTKFFILFLFLCFSLGQAQTYEVKLILIIDNKLVTEGLEMNFYSNDTIVGTHLYEIGKELKIDKSLINENSTSVAFNYNGFDSISNFKNYKYDFEFRLGWLHNTNYLIIRIYNLDKKKFKKVFCKETKDYAIEIQNQVYYEANILCKELKNRF
jgi:hypothetical protein